MLTNKVKRLAELERQIAASHKQSKNKLTDTIWEQLSDAEHDAMFAAIKRREQPGYKDTAEDKAILQRWAEAVHEVVPMDVELSIGLRDWAMAFVEAVKSHA